MNMKQLRYVIVLANQGSFSKAADMLNISQPSLSQYVKKIEKQLNVELFERANGNVRLTDAGKIYIEAGRKILDLEHQMQNQFQDLSEYKTGSVVIGTTPFRSATMIPTIASKFKKQYPGMYIVVEEKGTNDLKEAAEKGEFDLCLITLPIDEQIFSYEVIMEEEIVVAVPSGSDLEHKLNGKAVVLEGRKHKAIDVKLLDKESFVMVTELQIMQKLLDSLCIDYNIVLKKTAVVKSLESQIEMVRAGIGGALIPVGIEKIGGEDSKITYFSLLQNFPRRKVGVIYRKEQYLSEPEKQLIEIMKSIEW